jgi:hypothetical protein
LFAHCLAYGRIGLDNQERVYIRKKVCAFSDRFRSMAKWTTNKGTATSISD